MASSLKQHVVSSLINAIYGKGVMRAGKGYKRRFLPLLALRLKTKTTPRAGKGCNSMDHTAKIF